MSETKFSPALWLARLMSQTGVGDIPESLREECLRKKSPQGVNESYFQWFTARPTDLAHGFEPEAIEMFKNLHCVEDSQNYKNEYERMISNRDHALSYMRNAENYLKRMNDHKTNILAMKGKSEDYRPEVEKIIADGWYKFDFEATKNQFATGAKALVFTTPKVMLKWFDPEKFIHNEYDMGQYRVHISPVRVSVHPFKDNTDVSGHVHPHVEASGGVCWGNGAEVLSKAMMTGELHKIMQTLRVILCTYNDGSPYVRMHEYVANGVQKIEVNAGETVFKLWGRVSLYDRDIEDHMTQDQADDFGDFEEDSEDGESKYWFEAYLRTKDGVDVDLKAYYVKLGDEYMRIPGSDIRDEDQADESEQLEMTEEVQNVPF